MAPDPTCCLRQTRHQHLPLLCALSTHVQTVVRFWDVLRAIWIVAPELISITTPSTLPWWHPKNSASELLYCCRHRWAHCCGLSLPAAQRHQHINASKSHLKQHSERKIVGNTDPIAPHQQQRCSSISNSTTVPFELSGKIKDEGKASSIN